MLVITKLKNFFNEVHENINRSYEKPYYDNLIRQQRAPKEIETGTIVGGFAHGQVFAVADKVVEAVKSGAIKKFIVMSGCDARMARRSYYTEFAEKLKNVLQYFHYL